MAKVVPVALLVKSLLPAALVKGTAQVPGGLEAGAAVGRIVGRLVGTGTGTVGKVAGDRVGTLEGLRVGAGVELGAIVGALEGRRVGRPEGVWVGLNVGEEAALHPGNLKLVLLVSGRDTHRIQINSVLQGIKKGKESMAWK